MEWVRGCKSDKQAMRSRHPPPLPRITFPPRLRGASNNFPACWLCLPPLMTAPPIISFSLIGHPFCPCLSWVLSNKSWSSYSWKDIWPYISSPQTVSESGSFLGMQTETAFRPRVFLLHGWHRISKCELEKIQIQGDKKKDTNVYNYKCRHRFWLSVVYRYKYIQIQIQTQAPLLDWEFFGPGMTYNTCTSFKYKYRYKEIV